MKTLTHGSLFSGIGGADLAAHWAGWTNLFHCDTNEFTNQILNYYFPNAKSYTDIRQTNFKEWSGRVDVLTGGFPCQPFSVAGKRKGTEDNRYLWKEFRRVIQEIKPTWIIAENVDGIISMVQPGKEIEVASQASLFQTDNKEVILEQEFVIESICRDFEQEGYKVQPVVIPACGIGAPHRRYRIWIIAYSDSNDAGRHRHGEVRQTKRENKREQEKRERLRKEPERTSKEGISSNSDNQRCNNGSSYRRERYLRVNLQRNFKENKSERFGREYWTCETGEATSDTECSRGRQIHEKIQSEKSDGVVSHSNGNKWDASDSDISGLQGSRNFREFGETREESGAELLMRPLRPNWEVFPTQPPICVGDDGLSDRLVGITFSKWRKQAVSALGNAMVPQVIYEIFKGIELIYEGE